MKFLCPQFLFGFDNWSMYIHTSSDMDTGSAHLWQLTNVKVRYCSTDDNWLKGDDLRPFPRKPIFLSYDPKLVVRATESGLCDFLIVSHDPKLCRTTQNCFQNSNLVARPVSCKQTFNFQGLKGEKCLQKKSWFTFLSIKSLWRQINASLLFTRSVSAATCDTYVCMYVCMHVGGLSVCGGGGMTLIWTSICSIKFVNSSAWRNAVLINEKRLHSSAKIPRTRNPFYSIEPRLWATRFATEQAFGLGTDIMILKILSPKNSDQLAFSVQNNASFCKFWIIIFLNEKRHF
jgi:hypothetical protein